MLFCISVCVCVPVFACEYAQIYPVVESIIALKVLIFHVTFKTLKNIQEHICTAGLHRNKSENQEDQFSSLSF